jgi:HAE1 family hydrophobic/amphiphilic exporter-1
MNVSAPFIARPIATALLMVAILLGGIVAYPLLPIAALPNVNYPTLQVTAQLPGTDPETMAATVATPLETQFGEIPGLTQMTSASALGFTQITLQFDLSRPIDGTVADTLSAINAASAQLPLNMPYPPTIRKVNPADTPIIVLALTSDTLPITIVDAFAENILMQKLSQISGVGLVGIAGQQKPAVRIQVDPQALAARGISLEDVRSVISQANVLLPKGTLNSPRQSYTLNTNDQLLKPGAYDDVIVAYRNGSPVRVKDIGRAIDGPENNRLAAWYNKTPAIVLPIQRQPGANVIATVDRINMMLPILQASIPSDIKISVVSDRTATIRASVSDVQFTLVIAVALVVMVIFLFLRNFWATVIPAIAVPLSLIGTFAVLYGLGYSLDNLSLMALTVATGFVVDDAVVVIENTVRHLEEGMSPLDAALKSAGEIGFTIISITISLIAVFIPLFLMSGYIGLLFREFAVAVSVALVLSLVISLTLTPMMCARLLKPEGNRHGPIYRLLENAFDGLLKLYEVGLKVVLRHRFTTLMVMVGTIALTGYLYWLIPKGFFPQQDTGLIIGFSEAAQDISFQAMSERQQALINAVLEDPAVDSVGTGIGAGGGNFTPTRPMFVAPSPRPAVKRGSDHPPADDQARQISIALYMRRAGHHHRRPPFRDEYPYTLADSDPGELAHWAPLFLKSGRCPHPTA